MEQVTIHRLRRRLFNYETIIGILSIILAVNILLGGTAVGMLHGIVMLAAGLLMLALGLSNNHLN